MPDEPAKEAKNQSKIKPIYIAILAAALIIGAFALPGKNDSPTGKIIEPELTPEQIAEFNSTLAECNAYIADKDADKTIDCLRRADAIKADIEVITRLADLYSITGDTVEALGYYIRATEIAPDDARIRYNYAIALEKSNLTDDALVQYAKAQELDNNYTAAMNNRAILLQKLKRFNESKQEFENALLVAPDETAIIANHANLLAEMGLNQEAEAEFRRAILLAPNDKGIYRNFAQFLYNNGRYAEAKDMLEKS